MDDQTVTPLADALAALTDSGLHDRALLRLAIPGHSGDATAAPGLAAYFGESLLRRDFGCLVTGLDKGAGSPLDRAQRLAAQLWGASRAWFLTNGASQGNRLAALALGQFGDRDAPVIVQRSVHSSVIDGVILADLDPVFVAPGIDRVLGINHGVTAAAVSDALVAYPRAKAVWVVSPSYFGAVADIAGIASAAHAHGVPLIVDAAWGSHFGFHEGVPANPLHLGADLVISSTHKAAGSLTQSAMLHLGTGPQAHELEPYLDRTFPLTASTSVSMPLLASLDIARAGMASGSERIAAAIAAADRLRDAVRAHPRLAVVSDGFAAHGDIVDHDPLRVAIDVTGSGVTGNELRERLATEHGIYVEIATLGAIVAFIGPGYSPDEALLLSAIDAIAGTFVPRESDGALTLPTPGARRMRPRAAFLSASELVPTQSAIGRIASDALSAYPPGIPNVLPGEELTAEVIAFLQATATMPGGYVRGAVDEAVTSVRVVRG